MHIEVWGTRKEIEQPMQVRLFQCGDDLIELAAVDDSGAPTLSIAHIGKYGIKLSPGLRNMGGFADNGEVVVRDSASRIMSVSLKASNSANNRLRVMRDALEVLIWQVLRIPAASISDMAGPDCAKDIGAALAAAKALLDSTK